MIKFFKRYHLLVIGLVTNMGRKRSNKYFCKKCMDTNWLIECADGCGEVLSRCNKYHGIRFCSIKGY